MNLKDLFPGAIPASGDVIILIASKLKQSFPQTYHHEIEQQ